MSWKHFTTSQIKDYCNNCSGHSNKADWVLCLQLHFTSNLSAVLSCLSLVPLVLLPNGNHLSLVCLPCSWVFSAVFPGHSVSIVLVSLSLYWFQVCPGPSFCLLDSWFFTPWLSLKRPASFIGEWLFLLLLFFLLNSTIVTHASQPRRIQPSSCTLLKLSKTFYCEKKKTEKTASDFGNAAQLNLNVQSAREEMSAAELQLLLVM